MFGSRDRYASSLGSGVIVSADGYIITNNHVLRRRRYQQGHGGRWPTSREVQAKIVGVDTWTDLAVLKIDVRSLPVDPRGAISSKLQVGEWVMAIGNPFSSENGHARDRRA